MRKFGVPTTTSHTHMGKLLEITRKTSTANGHSEEVGHLNHGKIERVRRSKNLK